MNDQKRQAWPEKFSERFHIFALGESFDVDAFLAQSALHPDFVWRRMGNGPTNGIELLLGDSETNKLPEQERIAIAYLRNHREELRALANFQGVEAVDLGLVYRVGEHVTGVCVGPTTALMLHALDAGVSPRYYITILGR
jgi:hypothetical protein